MFFHTSKCALPHAVRGFVSFGSGLWNGVGGSRELLSAKILLLCAAASFVLSLAVYQLQKAHRHIDKNKQECHKTFSSWVFSDRVQSAF